MAITDIIFLILLLILISNGASKGFVRSIIGPSALIIATTIAWFCFKTTQQPLIPLLIAAIGPLVIAWLVGLAFLNTPTPARLTPLSRASGAIINAAWGGTMFVLLLAIPIIFPLKNYGAGMIADDVTASYTFRIFQGPLTTLKLITPETSPASTPASTEEDIASVMNDERIQRLFSDPEIQTAIEKKDIGTLLSHPTVMELAKDPALMAKMLRLYPEMQKKAAEMGSQPILSDE